MKTKARPRLSGITKPLLPTAFCASVATGKRPSRSNISAALLSSRSLTSITCRARNVSLSASIALSMLCARIESWRNVTQARSSDSCWCRATRASREMLELGPVCLRDAVWAVNSDSVRRAMSSWVEVSVSVSVSGSGLSTWMKDERPEERKEAEELVELAERGGEDMKLKLRLWVIGNDNELRGQSYVNCLDSKLCLMIQGRLINRVQGLVDVCGLEFRHIGGLGTYIYAGKKTKFGHEPKYRENMTWKAFTQAESKQKKKKKSYSDPGQPRVYSLTASTHLWGLGRSRDMDSTCRRMLARTSWGVASNSCAKVSISLTSAIGTWSFFENNYLLG